MRHLPSEFILETDKTGGKGREHQPVDPAVVAPRGGDNNEDSLQPQVPRGVFGPMDRCKVRVSELQNCASSLRPLIFLTSTLYSSTLPSTYNRSCAREIIRFEWAVIKELV